ncbi:hypothetical protein B8Z52_004097 [Enterobacter hormaechei]|uniref:hypothetical protein n=1 Tax=unclassified Enterobacter cloacae complex TaxID=2757714 RepID=UPI0012DFFE55|nr:hypothetical protein [Enterobacter sp. BIDMC87]EHF4963695.1 hypothetical protein [Enterobacter hormaechei]EHF4979424.1 hypothetical protein [Enterobacter hormaechei]EHF4988757.1 hypothetical protein [Enterobacter hormaechei]MCE1390153.1 hypothetical protein [Enterobacter hormaechei]
MEFTKEQLAEHITRQLDQFHRLIKAQPLGDNAYNQKNYCRSGNRTGDADHTARGVD